MSMFTRPLHLITAACLTSFALFTTPQIECIVPNDTLMSTNHDYAVQSCLSSNLKVKDNPAININYYPWVRVFLLTQTAIWLYSLTRTKTATIFAFRCCNPSTQQHIESVFFSLTSLLMILVQICSLNLFFSYGPRGTIVDTFDDKLRFPIDVWCEVIEGSHVYEMQCNIMSNIFYKPLLNFFTPSNRFFVFFVVAQHPLKPTQIAISALCTRREANVYTLTLKVVCTLIQLKIDCV
jgi:hypothetical protein